jgi:hypothetical protein
MGLRRGLAWIGAAALTASAALAGDAPAGAAAPPFRVVLDMHALMDRVIDPAADVIWESAGTVVTLEGERDLAPTTDEGWSAVQNAAALLAESGNLLLVPARVRPGAEWARFSVELSQAGERAMAAAEARDGAALFEIGAELYQICLGCHVRYIVEEGSGS